MNRSYFFMENHSREHFFLNLLYKHQRGFQNSSPSELAELADLSLLIPKHAFSFSAAGQHMRKKKGPPKTFYPFNK